MGEDGIDRMEENDVNDNIWNEQRCIDVPGLSQGFLVCNQQLSMTRVLREVKRSEHSVSNCIASIVHDASFVRQVQKRYGYPVCGNKRCGAWYTGYSKNHDTCYFKSTDGHVNQWSFSIARLNLHVAMHALDRGGCIIVDATRRGKKFPDALSKTVPIWAAVVNTCVLLYQMDHGLPLMDDSESFLTLPEWVPEQEQFEIEKRIDGWATQLCDSDVDDISHLAAVMTKPLRCCWVHPSETGWINTDMDSPILILVSASLCGLRERKQLLIGKEEIMYDYVPGAGDDEESWARKLTPSVMWKHYEDILQSQDSLKYISTIVSREGRAALEYQDSTRVDKVTWFGETGLGVAPIQYVTLNHKEIQSCAVVNVSDTDLEEWVGCPSTALQTSHAVCGGGMTVKDAYVLDVREESQLTQQLWIRGITKRNPIIQCAPVALEFTSLHICENRNVVFVYDANNAAIAVGLVLGVLITCFDIPQADQHWQRTSSYSITESRIQPAHHSFSRDIFKTYVAKTVAQYCPHIIVSKSVLKQVFNIFIHSNVSM